MGAEEKRELARQAREAQADMAVFARVLEATRANLNVMRRLREMRDRRLEYSERLIRGGASIATDVAADVAGAVDRKAVTEVDAGAEGAHGDD